MGTTVFIKNERFWVKLICWNDKWYRKKAATSTQIGYIKNIILFLILNLLICITRSIVIISMCIFLMMMSMITIWPMHMCWLLKLIFENLSLIRFISWSSHITVIKRALFTIIIRNIIQTHLFGFLFSKSFLFVFKWILSFVHWVILFQKFEINYYLNNN